MIIDELWSILGFDMRGEGDAQRLQRGLDGLSRMATGIGERIASIGALAGTAAVAGMGALGVGILDTAGKFEGYSATLETIEGTSEKAGRALEWITRFARTTPYQADELTAAFVELRSYGLDPMSGTLGVIGDTAAAMSKPLSQAVEAWADASTGEFERLKEFGLRSSQAAGRVTFTWAEGGRELSKTVDRTSDAIGRFLNETMGRRFGGAMLRQSRTWEGMLSNVADAWVAFQLRIANAGFFDVAKERLAGMMDALTRMGDDGTIDALAGLASAVFTRAADAIGATLGQIARHVAFISANLETARPYLAAIAGALVLLGAAVAPVAAAFALAALAVDDLLTFLEGGDSMIGSVSNALRSGAQRVVQAMRSMFGGIDFGDAGHSAANMLADAMAVAMDISAQLTIAFSGGLARGIASIGGTIVNAIRDVIASIDIAAAASRVARAIGERLLAVITGAIKGISDAVVTPVAPGTGNADPLKPIMPNDDAARMLGTGADTFERNVRRMGTSRPNDEWRGMPTTDWDALAKQAGSETEKALRSHMQGQGQL